MKSPLGLKPDRPAKDPARLARLHDLPCAVCTRHGEVQRSPTQAHHCISGRFSQRKAPDIMAIALCAFHHQGGDKYTLAIHQGKAAWEAKYGLDTDYLEG